MSLTTNVRDEFSRSPVTVIATVVGVLVAALALGVAWLQYAGQPQVALPPPTGAPPTGLHLSHLLVVNAFFFAATISLASGVRLLTRFNPFAAFILSIPAAVLASFSVMLMLYLVPPRQLDWVAFVVVRDIVFYGTAFVFIALNGLPVIQSLMQPIPPTSPNEKKSESGSALLGIGFALIVWGSFVSAGLNRLTQVFLS
jgi:hypothetical protein